jgi:hypothetical protein
MPRLCGAVLLAAVLGCAVTMTAQAGPAGFPASISDPPAKLPEGCPAAIVAELAKATGTPVYKSIHREIAALRLGHAASGKLKASVTLRKSTLNSATLHDVVQVMTGLDAAQSLYLCASFVVAQGSEDAAGSGAPIDRILRTLMVPALNKMALETWRLENTVVMRNESAEAPSKILDDRKQTDSDLLDAVKQSGALLVGRDSFQVNCEEKRMLQAELDTLAKSADADEFTSAAGVLGAFLEQPLACKV